MIDFDVTARAEEFAETASFEIGVLFDICVKGFEDTPAVNVVVTFPNGSERTLLQSPESGEQNRRSPFFAYPPNPLGEYHVRATQGSASATGTFEIVAPKSPKLVLLLYEIVAGGSVPVALSGFDPRERIELYLYRATGYSNGGEEVPTRIYTRGPRVAVFRVDARGFARRSVVVRRRGSYKLAAGGLFNRGFGFIVHTR